MPRLATTALIAAPLPLVVEVARDVGTAGLPLGATGVLRGLVADGDLLVLRPGHRRLVSRVDCRAGELALTVVEGRWRGLSYRQWVRPTAAGTLVTDEVRWPATVPLSRRLIVRVLRRRAALITAAAAARTLLVVGAALLDGGRVLVAQRAAPRAHAGWWELPGGKVEPGETPEQALHRECAEELGVEIALLDRLGSDLLIGDAAVLRVWTARIAAGDAIAREHAELRWLGPDELDSVKWLPADLALLPELRGRLLR
ncbi:MAG TPA: (deoxy)nucleoside triphosphate pyrophosphohydrolase [Mycobacteriales bacterium]|jgi:8-oxo-dGTP diphosphatase|nr:(deoxy)nucleoside triphosphate pyrophosphohydrolase [Mycobacteriales bacterium]